MLAAGDTVVSHYQAQCLIPAGTWIDQFRIPHDRWIQGLIMHLYRVSLDLKKIFINIGEKVTRIWKLNNTQSCKQVISLNLWIFYFRSRLTLYKCAFSVFVQRSWRIRNRTIVQKPVNANPGLNVNQIITFSSFLMFLLLCFVYMVIIETENRRPNNLQITKLKSKFYLFLG